VPMALTDTMPDGRFEHRIGRSVSLDHAARLLGVSRRTIYNRIHDGRLHTIRTLGGSQRVLLASVRVFRAGVVAPEQDDGSDGLFSRPGCRAAQVT
jgi:excisionase family DNA binding protein